MNSAIISAIIRCESENFRNLALIAGGNPVSFYRGSNFDGEDLRGEDLRGFCLHGCSFRNAIIDKTTLIDSAFQYLLRSRRGVVKWFNQTKGYGFISQNGGSDIFVHITAVYRAGIHTLNQGDLIYFDVEGKNKTKFAVNILQVDSDCWNKHLFDL